MVALSWVLPVGAAILWPAVDWIASFVTDPFLAAPVLLLDLLVFGGCGLALIGRELIRRRWRRAGFAVTLVTAMSVSAVTVDWSSIGIRGFFLIHHAEFEHIAELARDGRLPCGGYFDDQPLGSARYLSVDGRFTLYGSCVDPQGMLLPRAFKLVDGGAGYVWFSGNPVNGEWDMHGDPLYACRSLGGGWYWAVGNGCS